MKFPRFTAIFLPAFFLPAFFLPAFILLTANCCLATDDWRQFRGTANRGVADKSARPPIEWNLENDLDNNLVWETDIPGVGWSSPVFSEKGLIWLTTAIAVDASPEAIKKKLAGDPLAEIKTVADSVELKAIAIDLNEGRVVHDISLARLEEPGIINPLNSYASPTPAIADGKVVCHFGSYGTWCLNESTAETLWEREFIIDHSVGPGSSPVIHDDKVILVCDGTDQQFIAAIELSTGEDVWKTDRPPIRAVNGEQKKAYCTPLMIEVNGVAQAVIPGSQWIVAYDPQSGAEIWRADHGSGFSVTPMAVYESGLIIFSTGYGRADFVAVDPSGHGDVSESHIKWRGRNAPTMSSFIGRKGEIFAITDKGILVRLDAQTGTIENRKRIGGNFSASPLLAEDRLYIASREGLLTVIQCNDEMEILATNKFASPILASPAVSGDDLIVRTKERLYRIKKNGTDSKGS